MISSNNDKGTLEMVIAMLLCGTIGYFVVESGQSFWNVVFYRCLIGAVSLVVYMVLTRTIHLQLLDISSLKIIFIGGVALVSNWVMLFASFDYVPFSIATVVYNMQPIMLVIMGALLSHQLPSRSIVLWLLIALCGLFLVVELSPSEIMDIAQRGISEGSHFWGIVLALGAALLYTVTTLLTKKVSHIPSRLVALIHVSTGCIFLLPLVNFSASPTEISEWGNLLALGVVNTGFMYIMLYNAFQKLTTNMIAILSFIYPVTALVVDYLAFDNSVNSAQGAGVVLILTAVCAVKFNWRIGNLILKMSARKDKEHKVSI